MGLRIVDAELPLNQALDVLEATLLAWADGRCDLWQSDSARGPAETGLSFARKEDVYLFIHRRPGDVSVGVALAEKDRDLVCVTLPRGDPARERRRFALAEDEAGESFLLVAVDELQRQGLRDPLTRLAGAPQVKGARVGERDYVLIGPLGDRRVAEALIAVAALHPLYQRHVEKLGALAAESDALDFVELYKISPRVARQHRVHAKVVNALFQRLHGQGFELDDLRQGFARADFAMSRRDLAVAFEVRAAAEAEDLWKSIGQLVFIAPKGSGWRRCLVLPGPRDPLGSVLAPFEAALAEAEILLLMYDLRDGGITFWPHFTPEAFPNDLARAFG